MNIEKTAPPIAAYSHQSMEYMCRLLDGLERLAQDHGQATLESNIRLAKLEACRIRDQHM